MRPCQSHAPMCVLVCVALAGLVPAARGQTPYDEVTGVLEITADEATIAGTPLIYVPPQTGVDVEPLLAQTADNLRSLDGQEVRATGQFQGGILWGAQVQPVTEESQVPVEYFGPAAEFDELTGILEVTGAAASIEGTRLIYVPPQSRVDVRDLLAQTADNVRGLNGQPVRATGQLEGGILWSAVVERVEEEEVVGETIEETVVEEAVEEEPAEEPPAGAAVQEVPPRM